MATFPTTEDDLLILFNDMRLGYTLNPTIFPHADVPGLEDAGQECANAIIVQRCLLADVKIAAEATAAAWQALVEDMTVQLRQSEVDTVGDPVKLALIGWGPKAEAMATRKPGQVRTLEATYEGPGMVELDWKPPNPARGGAVRTYLILRRMESSGGVMGEWEQVGISLSHRITLSNQMRFRQLEYRVAAVNGAGVGVPSNTVAVVL